MSCRVFKEKQIDKKYIKQFWKDWQKPEKTKKTLIPDSHWTRTVLRVSPTVLGTVRRFKNAKEARRYIKNSKENETQIIEANPKLFVLQPIQFLSKKGNLVLERVYTGPDCINFYLKKGRYFSALKRRLRIKGINLDQEKDFSNVKKHLERALDELQKIIYFKKIYITINDVNYLLLDFDQKTKKFILGIIDHENPRSIQEN